MESGYKEITKYVLTFALLIAVFYGGSIVLRRSMGTDNPMMVVISQSMIPTLGVGDFIFIEAIEDFDDVAAGDPPVGDILVFLRRNTDEYIVHRAISVKKTDDGWVYTTKGDNNHFPDGIPVQESDVIGRVVNRVPIMGYFSLFIKTMKGFLLVAAFMAVSFFYDGLLPPATQTDGKPNYLALAPFAVPVLALIYMWVRPGMPLMLESLAVVAWYIGSIILPLSMNDDDMSLMIWLYHLVLVMIPIMCDIVWWTMDITPSMWWSVQGSTVPVTWLLMEETQAFNQSFQRILLMLTPGTLAFLFNIYGKRKQWPVFLRLSGVLQGCPQPLVDDQ